MTECILDVKPAMKIAIHMTWKRNINLMSCVMTKCDIGAYVGSKGSNQGLHCPLTKLLGPVEYDKSKSWLDYAIYLDLDCFS